jgi:hypothetical protein
MPIEVRYIVKHKEKEMLVTSDKKEADKYDKMLEVAENLSEFIRHSGVEIDESNLEELTIKLASEKDVVQKLLKGKEFSPSLLTDESADKPKGSA